VSAAGGIMIAAGTVTFVNEWWQARQTEWRIPIATIIAAALMEGLSTIDAQVATGLAVLVFTGAVVTRVNGKSVADSLADAFAQPRTIKSGGRNRPPVQEV
jgi:Na+/H+ antiporter NhaA